MRGKLPLKSWDGDPNTPRGMMDKTSPEWVRRTIERLRWSLEQVKTTEEEYEKTLNELRDSQAWKILNYPGLEEMLTAETGMDSAERSRRVMGQHGGERPGSGRNPKLLNSHVDPDGKTDQNQVDNVNLKTQGGNHSTYLRARLQRDHPEILERTSVISRSSTTPTGQVLSRRQSTHSIGNPPTLSGDTSPRQDRRITRKRPIYRAPPRTARTRAPGGLPGAFAGTLLQDSGFWVVARTSNQALTSGHGSGFGGREGVWVGGQSSGVGSGEGA